MFHAAEQAILDRLTAGLAADPDFADVKIKRHADLAETRDGGRQFAPYVAVIYDEFTASSTPGPTINSVQKVDLHWYVVVGTKSAKKNGRDLHARDAAGALADKILELLLGFHVGSGSYLRLRESPGPEYEDGYCFLPIGFTSSKTLKGKS